MVGKNITLFLLTILGFLFIGTAGALSNPINSTVATQTTSVPIAYRAIVGIVLIIVAFVAVWKFFKLFIGAIFAFIILTIILSTAYYFFKTGTFSIHNSLAFLEYIWQFFSGTITTVHTISKTVNSISNVTHSLSTATNSITNTINTT